PRQSDRPSNLLPHVWRHRRAENKCPRVVDEMLLQRRAPAIKRARAGKRLSASVHRSGKLLCDSIPDSNPASCGSLDPGRVSFVHNNTGAVTFGKLHDLCNRSDIAFHAKNALGNDELAPQFVRKLIVTESVFNME